MKTEMVINEKYSHLEDFVRQLPENFQNLGDLIYAGRNDVRVIEVNGLLLAVKFFKRMTLVNRYVYATMRKTKAQRSFEHTGFLLENGITSPENVAYINSYKSGRLDKAFYVSVYTNYQPLNDLISRPISETAEAFKAFAGFTYRLHSCGIYHNDFTIFNILYSYDGREYDFSLIDNNRMAFGSYSYHKGMRNLKRLSIPVEILGLIAAEYSRVARVDELKTIHILSFFRWHYLSRHLFKWKMKAPIRWLKRKHAERAC